jgi:hypothetical protein
MHLIHGDQSFGIEPKSLGYAGFLFSPPYVRVAGGTECPDEASTFAAESVTDEVEGF